MQRSRKTKFSRPGPTFILTCRDFNRIRETRDIFPIRRSANATDLTRHGVVFYRLMRRSTPRVRTVDGWNNVIFVDPKSIWSRGLHLRVNATLLCFVRQLRLIIHRKAIDKSENLTYVVGRPCLSARPIVYELYDFIEYERLLITRVQYETLLKYVFLYNARAVIFVFRRLQ